MINSLWHRISFLGTRANLPESTNRKLILGNRVAALAGLLVLALSFLFLDYMPQFLSYVVGSLLCFMLLFLNALGFINFSRISFCFSIPILMAITGSFFPEDIRIVQKITLLASITVPLVLFGITEPKWMTFGLIWTIFCFFAFDYVHEYINVTPATDATKYNAYNLQFIGAMISFTIFISTYIYLQKLNQTAENKLKMLLDETTLQKLEIVEQKQQLEKHNRELQIRAFSAQMNPHFLYNSLNSIQHFLTINDKTSSLMYLSKFGKLIRQFIDYSDKGFIPLADELKLLKYYLELESLRFDEMFKYELEVDEELLLYSINVPLLLIQSHAENAILHGLIGKKDDRKLTIDFSIDGDFMLCRIEDNGIGRKASEAINRSKSSYHIPKGVEWSKQRLILIYEDQVPENLIKIVDLYDENQAPAGTRVNIKIPLENT